MPVRLRRDVLVSDTHAHACGHRCLCVMPDDPRCPECVVLALVRSRFDLDDLSDGDVLYLVQRACERSVRLVDR